MSEAPKRERRAQLFLLLAGTVFLVVFAIPILVVPYTWADVFGWSVGERNDLTTYFARSLGAIATALSSFAIFASGRPSYYRMLFPIVIIGAALASAIHVVGAIEGSQPLSEDLEVLFYAGLAALAYWCMPRGA